MNAARPRQRDGPRRVNWRRDLKTHTITDEPKKRGVTKEGVQAWGPLGGGIWAAPTIDARRNVLYIATGNGFSDPQQPTDAVIAMDLDKGTIKWVAQPVPKDVWMMGCQAKNPDNPRCPAEQGPDHDFSASPMLAKKSNGQDILIIQSKSGMAYAFDPDKGGARLWEYKTSNGSGLGGQWGGAVDNKNAYFSVNGTFSNAPGGIRAVNLETGKEVWTKAPEPKLCGNGRGCSAAQGAAVTAVPGIVFSGSLDGGFRAYATDDGTLVWSFDTNKEFSRSTAEGQRRRDGRPVPLSSTDAVCQSGYGGIAGRPGNVLLAFELNNGYEEALTGAAIPQSSWGARRPGAGIGGLSSAWATSSAPSSAISIRPRVLSRRSRPDVQGAPSNADQNRRCGTCLASRTRSCGTIGRPPECDRRRNRRGKRPIAAGRRRIQDPGAFTLILIVRQLIRSARLKTMGTPIVTTAAPADVPSAARRVVVVKDPDGHFSSWCRLPPGEVPAPGASNIISVRPADRRRRGRRCVSIQQLVSRAR
jgi:outer membrane protein assembly factor BamB